MELVAYILLLVAVFFIWMFVLVRIGRKSIEMHSEIENPPTHFAKVMIDVAYITWAAFILCIIAFFTNKISYLILG